MKQATVLLYELEFRDDDYPPDSEAWCDAVMKHREMLSSRMAAAMQGLFDPNMQSALLAAVEVKALIELVLRSNWRIEEVKRIKIRTPPRIFVRLDEEKEGT